MLRYEVLSVLCSLQRLDWRNGAGGTVACEGVIRSHKFLGKWRSAKHPEPPVRTEGQLKRRSYVQTFPHFCRFINILVSFQWVQAFTVA
jgi:hypothetical protein